SERRRPEGHDGPHHEPSNRTTTHKLDHDVELTDGSRAPCVESSVSPALSGAYSGTQLRSAMRTSSSLNARPANHSESSLSQDAEASRARAMRNFGCGVGSVCSSSASTSS